MLCSWLLSLRKKKEEAAEENQGNAGTNIPEPASSGKENFSMEIENGISEKKSKEIKENKAEKPERKEKSILQKNCGETVVLSANIVNGPATLVSREPGGTGYHLFTGGVDGNWKNGDSSRCGSRSSYCKQNPCKNPKARRGVLPYRS